MADYSMPAGDAIAVLDVLDRHGVDACLSGGWSVDASLGEQTRSHSDLDLWVDASALGELFVAFVGLGLDRIFPGPGDRPWNFVLHDGVSRRVDLHLYETRPSGELHFGSVLAPFVLPGAALAGRGTIDGRPVRCERPAWAVRFHTGYPPRAVDRHDVGELCARFGLELPEDYR